LAAAREKLSTGFTYWSDANGAVGLVANWIGVADVTVGAEAAMQQQAAKPRDDRAGDAFDLYGA
jgi:hypothetical protein